MSLQQMVTIGFCADYNGTYKDPFNGVCFSATSKVSDKTRVAVFKAAVGFKTAG
jgi:hypothetical protein